MQPSDVPAGNLQKKERSAAFSPIYEKTIDRFFVSTKFSAVIELSASRY
jgi:hypothetical protein